VGFRPWVTGVALRRHFQRREARSQSLFPKEEEEVAAAVAVAQSVPEPLVESEPLSISLAK